MAKRDGKHLENRVTEAMREKARAVAEMQGKPDCQYCGAEIPTTGDKCPKCGKLIWRPGEKGERPQC